MAIGSLQNQAVELNSAGATWIALPLKDGEISVKEVRSTDNAVVGVDTTKSSTGGLSTSATLQLYEGTGATSACKTMIDWFLLPAANRTVKTLRWADPSSVVGAGLTSGDFIIESITNFFQVDAANPDAKYMTINLVGATDLTPSTVASASGLTPGFTPVPQHLGLIKVTSGGSLVQINDIQKATSVMRRPTQAFWKTNTDAPVGVLQGAYSVEVTVTVLNDPAAGSDLSKMIALMDTGSLACELISPSATVSSGSNKFAGNFTFPRMGPIGKSTANGVNARTMDFLMKLDGALTYTQL